MSANQPSTCLLACPLACIPVDTHCLHSFYLLSHFPLISLVIKHSAIELYHLQGLCFSFCRLEMSASQPSSCLIDCSLACLYLPISLAGNLRAIDLRVDRQPACTATRLILFKVFLAPRGNFLFPGWLVAWCLQPIIFCLCNHSLCGMGRSGSGIADRDRMHR